MQTQMAPLLLISLLGIVNLVGAQFACPDNFTESTDGNSFCHIYEAEKLSYTDARASCIDQGGLLAKIDSKVENDYIVANILSQSWIGLIRVNETLIYEGHANETLDYINWYPGEPSITNPFTGAIQDCVLLYKAWKNWVDNVCDNKNRYVCETDIVCAAGWTTNPDDTEDLRACYKFMETAANFTDAQANCEAEGAVLYYPTTADENTYITAEFKEIGAYWVNFNDMVTEGTFLIPADQTVAIFEDWRSGEPNDLGGEDCAYVYVKTAFFQWCRIGTLGDGSCSDERPYICKATN